LNKTPQALASLILGLLQPWESGSKEPQILKVLRG
jgi:hypothetical protein